MFGRQSTNRKSRIFQENILLELETDSTKAYKTLKALGNQNNFPKGQATKVCFLFSESPRFLGFLSDLLYLQDFFPVFPSFFSGLVRPIPDWPIGSYSPPFPRCHNVSHVDVVQAMVLGAIGLVERSAPELERRDAEAEGMGQPLEGRIFVAICHCRPKFHLCTAAVAPAAQHVVLYGLGTKQCRTARVNVVGA